MPACIAGNSRPWEPFVRVVLAWFAIPLAIVVLPLPGLDSASVSHAPAREITMRRGVAYFEPPRSIGTPLDDLARMYSGMGLADRIAGRFRLESDGTLNEAARQLIRQRLTQRS